MSFYESFFLDVVSDVILPSVFGCGGDRLHFTLILPLARDRLHFSIRSNTENPFDPSNTYAGLYVRDGKLYGAFGEEILPIYWRLFPQIREKPW